MNWNIIFRKSLPHLVAVLAFMVIALAYMSPVMKGQNLKQHDIIQHLGASHQGVKYLKESNQYPFWNPWMFSGMPNYMIMIDYPSSISVHIGRLFVNTLPEPANLLLLYMLGAYIGLLLMGFNPFIAGLGAVAYAFTSYNIINIGAGHVSKAIAVGTVPTVLGAVYYTYKGNYWTGGVLLAFCSAVHQYANFVQITYYIGLILLIFALVALVEAVRRKQLRRFWIASAICIVAGILSVSNHANRYLVLGEYTKETTRGKNELSSTPEAIAYPEAQKNKVSKKQDGLDKEYAFSWSYGIGETLNLLVADSYGGSSFESPKEDSKMMQNIEEQSSNFNMPYEQLVNTLYSNRLVPSMYWGEQPGTGGPAYMGAILVFLFVLGMSISKNPFKWWAFGSVLLCLSIAWGKNFFLNDILFDYLPLFNKFRAVTMILSIAPIFMIIVAAMGLQEWAAAKEEQKKQLWNKLKWVSIGFISFLFLLAVGSGMFLDFKSAEDKIIEKTLSQQSPDLAKAIITGVQADRATMLSRDAWKALIFVGLAALSLWAYLQKYIQFQLLVIVLTFLNLADLWMVDKRYLGKDKFVDKEEARNIEASPVDEDILRDTSYYRVLNLGNPFNDASASYFHHSAGGYHGAKLRRYQDVISAYMSIETDSLYKNLQRNNGQLAMGSTYKPVLDILNIKYFIVPLQGNKSVRIQNPDAMGAAWFVENYQIASNADAELNGLRNLLPKKMSMVSAATATQNLKEVKFDASATIKLLNRSPNKMVYETQATQAQLAIFSEIYYKTITSGWHAYIDGQPQDQLRVNYILRGLVVPAGKHKIVFQFEPKVYQKGERYALISSILMVLALMAVVVMLFKKNKHEQK